MNDAEFVECFNDPLFDIRFGIRLEVGMYRMISNTRMQKFEKGEGSD